MDPVTRYQVDLGNFATSAAKLLHPAAFALAMEHLEQLADMAHVAPPQLRLVLPVEEPGDPLAP